MRLSHWTVYELATGRLVGQTFSVPEDQAVAFLAANIAQGHAAVEGLHDHCRRRVDLITGQAVSWQPPAPPDDDWQTWAWDVDVERWMTLPTLAAAQRDAIAPVQAEIDRHEARLQRVQREVLLALLAGATPPAAAVARLQATDNRCATLRGVRAAMAAAPDEAALASITWPAPPA